MIIKKDRRTIVDGISFVTTTSVRRNKSLTEEASKRLLACAHAVQQPNIESLIKWRLLECERSIGEISADLQDALSLSPFEFGIYLLDECTDGEPNLVPWSFNEPRPRRLEAFKALVDQWAQPNQGEPDGSYRVTEEECTWMREMCAAALAFDARRAQKLADKLRKAWDPEGWELELKARERAASKAK